MKGKEKSLRKGLKVGTMAMALLLLVGGVIAVGVTATPKETKPKDTKLPEKEILKKFKELEKVIPQSLVDISSIGIAGELDCDSGFTLTKNVCMKDQVYFLMNGAYFKGVYVSVWSGNKIGEGTCLNCNGSGYPQTFTTYKSPATILNEARQRHGSSISVHIKYFSQGWSGEWAYVYKLPGWFPLQQSSWIELWSEANYNKGTGSWTKYGYPDDTDGGAYRIASRGYVFTSAGYHYHLCYPTFHARSFGNPQITLYSNFGHQYAITS